MDIPDYTQPSFAPRTVALHIGNNKAITSPLIGIGYRWRDFDVLFNYRYLRTDNVGADFTGLGWDELKLSARVHF
jgi:hypothetical protein